MVKGKRCFVLSIMLSALCLIACGNTSESAQNTSLDVSTAASATSGDSSVSTSAEVASSDEAGPFTIPIASDDVGVQGFLCVVDQAGTAYWSSGASSFDDIVSENSLADKDIIAIEAFPDNGEKYSYLYPEKDWTYCVIGKSIPDWADSDTQSAFEDAFSKWKDDVYTTFNYEAFRSLTIDDTLKAAPSDDYTPTDTDVEAFQKYIKIEDSLPTYIRTSVIDTLTANVGPSIANDAWNFMNDEIAKSAKDVGGIGSLLHDLGVSNVGAVQNDFFGALCGHYFNISKWNYYMGSSDGYPYECAFSLWSSGLSISEDSSQIWRMHSADGGSVISEINDEEISPNKAFACIVSPDKQVYWKEGSDSLTASSSSVDGSVEVQVKPVLDDDQASIILPDGQNPEVTRYFPYLDDNSQWTLTTNGDPVPSWFDDSVKTNVMAAFTEWQDAVYGSFDRDALLTVFPSETKEISDYNDDDIKLLKEWAIEWHSIKDQGLDLTSSITMTGYNNIGNCVWDEIDAYLLAKWRVQHADCPGAIVCSGYWANQGITDESKIDHSKNDVVANSVSDVMEALTGYYFSGSIKEWYGSDNTTSYPFEAGADLVLKNLVPSTDGENWYLSSGEKGDVVYAISEADLLNQ